MALKRIKQTVKKKRDMVPTGGIRSGVMGRIARAKNRKVR